MIRFENVSVTYPEAERPVIASVDLCVPEGELCLVIGPTGSGKTTLLGAVNGHVPRFTGGTLHGRIVVVGRDTATHLPRELADIVGVVGQDPAAGFVTDVVEDELAYGMEQLGVPPATMRKRVEETLDLLGLAALRRRPLAELSGGQQQRVAIGAVLTSHPRVLVLDEPTSALDPVAAEEVIAAVTRMVHDLGLTVLLAEHRLERVAQYADRVVELPGDGTVVVGDAASVLARSAVAPPIVELGRIAGWDPPPLSVRDARRSAPRLLARLDGLSPSGDPPGADTRDRLLSARRLVVAYGHTVAVRGVDLALDAGQVAAIMGRNGSGKTSLMWALQGAGSRRGGTVDVAGVDPGRSSGAEARRLVGLVPQAPSDLLYLDSVEAECADADRESAAPPGSCRRLVEQLVPGLDPTAHPRDLSEGQRLGLVLAIQLTAAPAVVLLDEPTRGLDYAAKRRLGRVLRRLAGDGRAIAVSTHDVEFVATAADRVIVMAEGEIVADGPTAEIAVSSPAFAPQVAKVLGPGPWLSVDQVAAALSRRPS